MVRDAGMRTIKKDTGEHYLVLPQEPRQMRSRCIKIERIAGRGIAERCDYVYWRDEERSRRGEEEEVCPFQRWHPRLDGWPWGERELGHIHPEILVHPGYPAIAPGLPDREPPRTTRFQASSREGIRLERLQARQAINSDGEPTGGAALSAVSRDGPGRGRECLRLLALIRDRQ